MESIGDRIRARREQLGWTQAKLAEMLNIKVGTLSGYERNYRIPDARMLQLLAGAMKVSSDYLLGLSQAEANPTKRLIPLIGTIRAGLPILAKENIDGYLEVPDYMRADYAVQVKGDAMVGAGILDGDLAICCETEIVNSGQIVIALNDIANGFSEATLKYYSDNDKSSVLRPVNPNYPEFNMNDGYRIAGVMVSLIRKDVMMNQVFENNLIVSNTDEWLEVIDLASQVGLKVHQVKEILVGQIEIAKRLRDI